MTFPQGFLWGASSAAAQIEGAYLEDGKGLSIWDAAPVKKLKNGENCRVACDHYHRYREDVAIMKELGLNSYRFSISWPRIIPRKGQVNPKGIEFYKNLVAELKSAGIEPLVTLFHWDLPQWVQMEGGWKSPKVSDYFAEYVKIVVDALSCDVRYWMTINEPQCFIMAGNVSGVHAPFKHSALSIKKLVRNALLAHGRAVGIIRERAKLPPIIGVAMAASASIPVDESGEAVRRARESTFEKQAGMMNNAIWNDPIFLGKAPKLIGKAISAADMEIISRPIDFVGVNVYQPLADQSPNAKGKADERPRTMLNWVIDGRCLYWTIRFFHERYRIPVMVTENGMANPDEVAEDGGVHDDKRTAFLREYLREMKRAVDEDIPVLGYQHWSIMDNFEWAEGYAPRFGLVHVDYKTQKRTIKDSARVYAELIRKNGENL